MKLYEMYFSPTGGTRKVAAILGSAWACEKEEIDLLSSEEDAEEYDFEPGDVCIAAVPSFGGRVPEPALKRLGRMQGRGARAVLAAVYGNRDFEDTLAELREAMENAGFAVEAAVAAVAEHSIFPQFGAGRPDGADQKELMDYGNQIRTLLERGGGGELHIPGNHPYREYHGVPLKPRADKNCIKCGKCAAQCPVHAIPGENPASVERDKCISCMHCVAICPQKARSNNKMLVFAAAKKMEKSCGGRKENRLFLRGHGKETI